MKLRSSAVLVLASLLLLGGFVRGEDKKKKEKDK